MKPIDLNPFSYSISVALKQSDLLLGAVNDLAFAVTHEAGIFPMGCQYSGINVDDIIQGILFDKIDQYRTGKNISTQFGISEVPYEIVTDKFLLSRSLFQLISNAYQYSKNDEVVQIKAEFKTDPQDNCRGLFCFKVSNQMESPIDENYVNAKFEKYYATDRSDYSSSSSKIDYFADSDANYYRNRDGTSMLSSKVGLGLGLNNTFNMLRDLGSSLKYEIVGTEISFWFQVVVGVNRKSYHEISEDGDEDDTVFEDRSQCINKFISSNSYRSVTSSVRTQSDSESTSARLPVANRPPTHILVVDDSSICRRICGKMLLSYGLEYVSLSFSRLE